MINWRSALKSEIGKRMASGAFWSFTGTAMAKIIVLLSGIICARLLTIEEYGQLGMVRSTINMFVVFGIAGLGHTAIKYISEYRFSNRAKVYSIYNLTTLFSFITGLIVAIIVYFFSDYLAIHSIKEPSLAPCLKIGAFFLFITVLNGAQDGVIYGLEDFKGRAINTFISSLAESGLMLLGAYLYGVTGAFVGFGLGYLVLFVCNYLTINKDLSRLEIGPRRFIIDKEDFSLLYKFSLPAMLASIMVAPTYWITKNILINYSNYGELAVYEASDYWKTLIIYFPAAISQIVLPILSSISSSDTDKFWKVFRYNLYLNVGIVFLLTMIVAIASPWIMKSFGSEYEGKTLPLIVLAISSIFSTASSVVGLTIVSRAKMWTGLLFNFIWSAMMIGFSYLFIHMGMGATGLSLAILCAYFIHTIYQSVYIVITVNKSRRQ